MTEIDWKEKFREMHKNAPSYEEAQEQMPIFHPEPCPYAVPCKHSSMGCIVLHYPDRYLCYNDRDRPIEEVLRDPEMKARMKDIRRLNKALKNIPVVNRHQFEGIEHWHFSDVAGYYGGTFYHRYDDDMDVDGIIREAHKLLNAGHRIDHEHHEFIKHGKQFAIITRGWNDEFVKKGSLSLLIKWSLWANGYKEYREPFENWRKRVGL